MVQHVDTLEVNERNDVIGLNGLDVLGPLGPREGPGPAGPGQALEGRDGPPLLLRGSSHPIRSLNNRGKNKFRLGKICFVYERRVQICKDSTSSLLREQVIRSINVGVMYSY